MRHLQDFFEEAGIEPANAKLVLSAFYAYLEQEAEAERSGGRSHFLYPIHTSAKQSIAVCGDVLLAGVGHSLLQFEQ